MFSFVRPKLHWDVVLLFQCTNWRRHSTATLSRCATWQRQNDVSGPIVDASKLTTLPTEPECQNKHLRSDSGCYNARCTRDHPSRTKERKILRERGIHISKRCSSRHENGSACLLQYRSPRHNLLERYRRKTTGDLQ